MHYQAAAAVLNEAEERIAVLATKAATDRDYDTAETLLAVARQLSGAASKLVAASESPSNGFPASAPRAVAMTRDADAASADDAPKFERDGDELIKQSKSKSEAKAYEHKAPRRVIDSLLATIRESANKKGEFRTSRVLPLKDGNGREVPGYQGYLALRWLRQIGLVERVARERYKLDPDRDALSFVDAAWQALPQR